MALKGSGGGFKYKIRSKEQVRKRAEQKGGSFDSYLRDGLNAFTAKEGDHRVRVLPPTWDEADHYGYDLWCHYNVGMDKQSYLCLEKHGRGECPVCAERRRAEKDDPDYAKALAPSRRVLVWIINRDDEASGPLLYGMPWTLDRDIAAVCIDKRTGEHLLIDHPTKGFDIDFQRTGSQLQTKYIGIKVARTSTPIHPDQKKMKEWLDFVTENPVPDCLRFYESEYIQRIFEGGEKGKEKDPDVQPGEDEQTVSVEETPEETRAIEGGGEDEFVVEEEGTEAQPEQTVEDTPPKRGQERKPMPSTTTGAQKQQQDNRSRLAELRARASTKK